jgi:hypothetical protein
VAPTGKINPRKAALQIRDTTTDEGRTVKGGEALYYKKGGTLEITAEKGLFLKSQEQNLTLKTDLPVLFDCRGRGDYFTGESLGQMDIPEFSAHVDHSATYIKSKEPEIRRGEYEFERSLPYKGEIFVSTGDEVSPESIIGENRFGPPRLFIIDIQKLVGYERKLSEADIAEGLLVSVNDRIRIGTKIFREKAGILGTHTIYRSSVRGLVTRIEPSGLLIVREIQDYDGKPRTVNVAKILDIKPHHISGYLKFKTGDFVEKDQALAVDLKRRLFVKSPTTGTVKMVDTRTGTVTVQYDITPVPLKAFIKGRITDVREGLSVKIRAVGTIVYGIVGFGGENSGILKVVRNSDEAFHGASGHVLVSTEPADEGMLRKCAESDVSGIVAPSIDHMDWVNFFGQETNVAITGDEDIPFTLILTEGFGQLPLSKELVTLFDTMEGRTASLTGRTQIRAGVIRPAVIISD